jgi:hypothetical protein
MSWSLKEELTASVNESKRTSITKDVSLSLDNRYTNADRRVVKASLVYKGEDHPSTLALVMGFRSDIMASFAKFRDEERGPYLPADILGIVPAIAAVVTHHNRGLSWYSIKKGKSTHLTLVFERNTCKKGVLHNLSVSVEAFMEGWRAWSEILLTTISNDPVMETWKMSKDDIRELLLGESGFVTMPWFSHSLSYIDRARVLDRFLEASKALLNSVLTQKQFENPEVKELVQWLENLTPLPEIMGSTAMQYGEEMV